MDIMGNRDMITDVLHIVSGVEVDEKIVSNILEMSARVNLPASIR